jgi:hypothetical protein
MGEQNENLGTYLRDHYAGGVGALELLERLIKTQKGRTLKSFFEKLHADIQSDHEQLHRIMTALEIEESSIRDAAAWIAEKFSWPKLGSAAKDLALLQSFEALFMGISGKRMLWRALREIQTSSAILERFDFCQLEARASQQLERVEATRMKVVRESLGA